MLSGRLNQRIAIQSVTNAQDAKGEVTRAYKTLWNPWAELVSSTASETLDGKRKSTVGEATHVWRIRYRAGVNRNHRVLAGERPMEILSVLDPDNQRRELLLQCKEVL